MSTPSGDADESEAVREADATINEVGAVYLIAAYDIVLIALHLVVLLLFVPFEGARFNASILTLLPHTLLALYTLLIGTRGRTLVSILLAASLVVLVFSVIELGLRTAQLGDDRLVSITAILDVVLWFIALFYTIIALFYAIFAFRLRGSLESLAERSSEEFAGTQISGSLLESSNGAQFSGGAYRRPATLGVTLDGTKNAAVRNNTQ